MQKGTNTWSGYIAVTWMLVGLARLRLGLERYNLEFRPGWLYLIVVFLYVFGIWWGIGLLFALSGLRSKGVTNRICAILAICAFLYSAWHIVGAALSRAKSRGFSSSFVLQVPAAISSPDQLHHVFGIPRAGDRAAR
jgi:hypothetical protein